VLTTTAAPTGSAYSCPSGFDLYETACYKYVAEKATWQNAQLNCNNLNSGGKKPNLATIRSVTENNFVVQKCASSDVWIGIKRKTSDTFNWVSGSTSTYRNWNVANGQPYTYNCGKMNLSKNIGTWAAVQCSGLHPYVCQVSATPSKRSLSIFSKL
jgi:hypothetical protein